MKPSLLHFIIGATIFLLALEAHAAKKAKGGRGPCSTYSFEQLTTEEKIKVEEACRAYQQHKNNSPPSKHMQDKMQSGFSDPEEQEEKK